MKPLFLFFIILSLFNQGTAKNYESEMSEILILNMANESHLPRNFRTAQDVFKFEAPILPTRHGLDKLNISGSGQFSQSSLEAMLQKINKDAQDFYIVDLRQEPHGFLNGMAVSWYAPRNWKNLDKHLTQIEKEEKQLLHNTLKQKEITLHTIIQKDSKGVLLPETKFSPLIVETALTEQQIVKKQGAIYLRLDVTDHLRPSDATVDRFVTFTRHLPSSNWVHIHCAAGVGRTTMFMAMYDMMINAKQVDYQSIINRQWLLGGLNFNKMTAKSWKIPHTEERLRFLQQFYDYCLTNQDNFEQSWSSYISERQKSL